MSHNGSLREMCLPPLDTLASGCLVTGSTRRSIAVQRPRLLTPCFSADPYHGDKVKAQAEVHGSGLRDRGRAAALSRLAEGAENLQR